MSEPFIAEVRIFAGNFAPRGWAFCDGQLLAIDQNTALFSLVGTIYGGDGRSTLGLPDLRGRVPVHPGLGPGLRLYQLGQADGAATVGLGEPELPSHTHAVRCTAEAGNQKGPAGHHPAADAAQVTATYSDVEPNGLMGAAVSVEGAGQEHNNMQPYLTLNYIIALTGLFPSRN